MKYQVACATAAITVLTQQQHSEAVIRLRPTKQGTMQTQTQAQGHMCSTSF